MSQPSSSPLRADLALLRRSLRLFRDAAPCPSAAVAALTVFEALLPAACVWLLKRIIDIVAAARGHAAPAAMTSAALGLAGCSLLIVALLPSLCRNPTRRPSPLTLPPRPVVGRGGRG